MKRKWNFLSAFRCFFLFHLSQVTTVSTERGQVCITGNKRHVTERNVSLDHFSMCLQPEFLQAVYIHCGICNMNSCITGSFICSERTSRLTRYGEYSFAKLALFRVYLAHYMSVPHPSQPQFTLCNHCTIYTSFSPVVFLPLSGQLMAVPLM